MQSILRYLLLLTLSTVSLGSVSNKETQSLPKKGATKSCNGLVIPGVDVLIHSLDITELDNGATNGILHQAIALTCTEGRTWSSPSTEIVYQRPDQIAIVRPTAAGNLQIESQVLCSSEQYKRVMAAKVGLNDTEEGVFSVGAKKLQETLKESNSCLAYAEVTVSTTQINLKPPSLLQVSDSFAASLPPEAAIPKYEESPAVYDNLVATFGTHYFERAIFGGVLRIELEIDSAYIAKKDAHSIACNLESAFNQTFGRIISGNYEERGMTQDFSDFYTSSRTMEIYGGDWVLKGSSDAFEKWIQSVQKEPNIIGGQLKPIVDLIANQDIKAQVRKAIAAKLKASPN